MDESAIRQLSSHVDAWCVREGIAPGVRAQLASVHIPVAAWLARAHAQRGRALIAGVAGAQGTGKSTICALLAHVLEVGFGLRAALLALDDLYLTRAQRAALARTQHPLLQTRGVPGTHDVELGVRTIDALLAARPGDSVRCPRFDKAADDRAPEATWPVVHGPLDVLLFEGWCVGAEPEPAADLAAPINALEREADRDGSFRQFVNAQLAGPYRALFQPIDVLLFLAAPDLSCVLAWRTQQEHALAARSPRAPQLMSDAQLARFVQHYERLTRHMLASIPARADVVLHLAPDHSVARVDMRG
jgi:D-glycerate 3-kinase